MYPCTNSWHQLRHSIVKTSSSSVQLNGESPVSAIQSLSALNQHTRVISTRLVRGTDSCLVPDSISNRCIRNVPELRSIQAAMLSTESCNSRVGSVMDCHLNRHTDTVKKVQHSL